jgi:putative addiction module component (TIGR02574 family)
MSVSREELRNLPLAERLDLVEDLWDSIAQESEQLTLTPAQVEELDRRFADYQKNPDEGVAWEEIRDRVRTTR